jgi:exonuclease VII large subunit
VVPVLDEIVERLGEMSDRLYRVVRTLLEMQRHRFERSVGVMRDMRFRVQAHAQHLDELRDGLTRTLTERLTLLHRGWWCGNMPCWLKDRTTGFRPRWW